MKDIVTSASHISKLPKKCFKTVKVPILQEENEIDFEDPYPLIAGEEERTYIRAKYVMQHFSASFFEMMRDLSKSSQFTVFIYNYCYKLCQNLAHHTPF